MAEITKKIIEKYITLHPYMGNSDLARLIMKEEDGEDTTFNAVRNKIVRAKKVLVISEDDIEDESSEVSVEDGHYRWSTQYGDISFTVEHVDELFYEYSKHGLNLSQTQIINKHGFEAWEWQSVKRKLTLVKDSNIFSPHTVESLSGPDLEARINEKIARKYENQGELVEKAYQAQTLKAYKKTIDQSEKDKLARQIFENEILEMLPKADIKSKLRKSSKGVSGHAVIALADLHLGARTENLQNNRDFSPNILEGYLDKVADQVNAEKYAGVSLVLAGDLIESFTGLSHVNSWKGIEFGYYGSKVVIEAVELLSRFFSRINNLDTVLGVNGNHCRSTSSNKEDTTGEIGTIIFYMLEKIFGEQVRFNHHSDTVSEEIDGIQYIIGHGHLPEHKKNKSEYIINEYGNNQLYNMILTGHLHSRVTDADTRRSRYVVCPSLFTGNRYSKTLGFSSNPGYLRIVNNGSGRPNVTDISL